MLSTNLFASDEEIFDSMRQTDNRNVPDLIHNLKLGLIGKIKLTKALKESVQDLFKQTSLFELSAETKKKLSGGECLKRMENKECIEFPRDAFNSDHPSPENSCYNYLYSLSFALLNCFSETYDGAESLSRLAKGDDSSTLSLYHYNHNACVEEHVDRGLNTLDLID